MQITHNLTKRRTYKVIGNPDKPANASKTGKDEVDQLISAAGNAPFHYPCDRIHMNSLPSPVPWRSYKLETSTCQALMQQLLNTGDSTKVPNMLAAAQYLIQVTWLPDPDTILGEVTSKAEPVFSGTLRNMEHISAGSAYIQSLLLAADEAGFKTYWSSGGPLRGKHVFKWLGIPDTELLLGSVFLFPKEPQHSEIKPGNLAEKRGDIADWSRWCEILKDKTQE